MTTKLGTPIADFETQLATAIAVGGTTATLQSATDDDAVALPAGRYFFTIDMGNSVKEHISCTLSGTSLTNIKSVSRQGVETAGVARAHRIGASVTITDFAHIKFMNDLLIGTTTFNASVPLGYDGVATLTPGSNQFCTVVYADALAIAGSPDATTSQKGIGRVSVAPVSAAIPIFVGDNDGRVPTQAENDALVGNNTDIAVGTGNKMVTQTGLQHGAEKYAADAGANDTYVITLSPVPTSYTAGMVVHFKANTANTGAATLNVNSLGAKTIKKGVSTTLDDGDILAGQFCTVIYDGTDFILQNPVSTNQASNTFKNGLTTRDVSLTSSLTIAHGLGKVPKKVTIHGVMGSANTASVSYGSYNGSTQAHSWFVYSSANTVGSGDTTNILSLGTSNTAYNQAVCTVDATNITLTWTKSGSPTGTGNIMWEVEG